MPDTKFNDSKRLNDNSLLLLFSFPYLYDFLVGITSVIFLGKIADFNDHLKEKLNNEGHDEEKLLLAVIINL